MTGEFSDRLRFIVQRLGPELRPQHERDLETVLGAGGGSFEGLLAVAQDPRVDVEARRTACWLLGRLGDRRATPVLLSALKDEAPEVRAAAAWAVGDVGTKRAAAALASALKDKVPDVREAVARAMGRLGNRRALQPLIAILLTDEAEQVRIAAAHSLGRLRDRRALEPMVAVLGDPREAPAVRGMVAEQLTNLGDGRAIGVLLAALEDPSVEARFWAAYALGFLGDEKVVPALERAAATDDAVLPGWWSVKKEAADAIEHIKARLGEHDDV